MERCGRVRHRRRRAYRRWRYKVNASANQPHARKQPLTKMGKAEVIPIALASGRPQPGGKRIIAQEPDAGDRDILRMLLAQQSSLVVEDDLPGAVVFSSDARKPMTGSFDEHQ